MICCYSYFPAIISCIQGLNNEDGHGTSYKANLDVS